MNASRFDALARAATRRGALRALAGGLAAALALPARRALADPPLSYGYAGYTYDEVAGVYYNAYYRKGLLEGPGRYCTVDAAFVAGVARFKAVCEDGEYTAAQGIPTLLGIVTRDYDDDTEGVVGTCRKRPKKYRDRMVMRCNVAVV